MYRVANTYLKCWASPTNLLEVNIVKGSAEKKPSVPFTFPNLYQSK